MSMPAGGYHIHLQSYGIRISQHPDIVEYQNVFIEITGTELGTLCELALLEALLEIL